MTDRIHKLKCWPEPFFAIVADEKAFELREDDRAYAVGDVLELALWDPSIEKPVKDFYGQRMESGSYLDCARRPVGVREQACIVRVTVTYLVRGSQFGLLHNWVCLGIARKTADA